MGCVPGNYVHDVADAGLAILESFDAEIYDNVFENVKYGIRISLGGGNNDVHDNIFNNCGHCEFLSERDVGFPIACVQYDIIILRAVHMYVYTIHINDTRRRSRHRPTTPRTLLFI